MERHRFITRATCTVLTLLVILTAACHTAQTQLPAPATSDIPTPTSLPATPTLDTGGLNPDAVATLLSVEQVDKYPLYVMHYVGSYDYPTSITKNLADTDFGCSLFAALGDMDAKLYGRNFDWQYSPAMLLYTNPPDGYASVSMVNLFWLFLDWKTVAVLARGPLSARTGLLSAPSVPIDGMNEYGLVIGMALVTDGSIEDVTYDLTRPITTPLGIIRLMLDHARNVDEAVELFKQYNVDFSGAIMIHYLLADPSGKAVLLEFHKQELFQLYNNDPWHLATNHLRCIATGDGNCWRYHILSDHLTASQGQLDTASAMQLLSDIKQTSTQWSVVYNMNTGDVNVVVGTNYDTVHTFHLDLLNP
jgi:Acyl-coenzyme A:6-aminopenicillanic acid acyl-transferase